MPQGEQVNARLHAQGWVAREQRGGLHQTVDAVAAREADVVADGDVVEAGTANELGQVREPASPGSHIGFSQDDPEGQPLGVLGGRRQDHVVLSDGLAGLDRWRVPMIT
jgi:hypothetical protein